ncbi:ABC transporter permease [Harryflintia acetispora]|uniref:ABC transport system permease protein n=1 Tax=Harryflintia acetispora TaxID=1849041 RepID=A0A9X8UGZ5_9FIRM|nr:ABC transporter permease [Harryflintia acetispora]TCL41556.1 putative ABC transport system permease protein [Harryflintia acetispora]
MNIFHKVALQGLKKNRARTLVTVAGVALSAALITAVAAFGTSLLNFMVNGSIAKCGGWHVEFPDVGASFVQERIREREVLSAAAFQNIGYAALDGLKSPEKPYLFIAGFGGQAFDALPVTLISGRLPETSGEIIIPSHVSVKGGVRLKAGDTLTLAPGTRRAGDETMNQHDPYRPGGETLAPGRERTYTVVGTYERPGYEEHTAPGYTAITKADPGGADSYSLFVTLKNPRAARDYADRTAGAGDYVLNEDVLRFLGASDDRLFNTLLYSVGGVLVAIIMIGSVFLIYNSFNISLNERTHQFGLLMSVGATKKQLLSSVLFEGACIGAAGIPLGVLAGIAGTALLLPVVARNFGTITSSSVPLTLAVSVPALAAAAAISLVTILISAYIPARKAAGTPVMACILQTGEIKTGMKAVKPSKLAQRLYGLEGTLALKNFKRNKKRYRSVVLSLTLSVVLSVAGSAFGATLKQLAKEYTVEMDGDVSFYTQEMEENELLTLYQELKTAAGVYGSTYQADLTYPGRTGGLPADFLGAYREAVSDESTGETLELPIDVQFIEDGIYYDFIEGLGLPKAEYTGPNAKILMIGMNTAEHRTYFTGSTMDFTFYSAGGEGALTVSGTFVDRYPLDTLPKDSMPDYLFMAVAPWQQKPRFDALGGRATFGLTFWSDNPARSMAQMQAMIGEAGVAADYTLLNLSTTVDLFRSATFVVDVFTRVFVVMISLIAVANVFNTISTNIRLRRRELAMLRSVGMSERGFNKMMNFECAFYGMRTLLFGVPLAGLLAWLIYKAMALGERLEDLAFVFPWGSLAASVLGVFCIVFITMLYATSKIKKENIIDALRDDMT